MLSAAVLIPNAKSRLGNDYVKRIKSDMYGIGDCGVSWLQIYRMWLIIRIVNCNYSLTVDEQQCLLSKLQEICS